MASNSPVFGLDFEDGDPDAARVLRRLLCIFRVQNDLGKVSDQSLFCQQIQWIDGYPDFNEIKWLLVDGASGAIVRFVIDFVYPALHDAASSRRIRNLFPPHQDFRELSHYRVLNRLRHGATADCHVYPRHIGYLEVKKPN